MCSKHKGHTGLYEIASTKHVSLIPRYTPFKTTSLKSTLCTTPVFPPLGKLHEKHPAALRTARRSSPYYALARRSSPSWYSAVSSPSSSSCPASAHSFAAREVGGSLAYPPILWHQALLDGGFNRLYLDECISSWPHPNSFNQCLL